MCRPRRLLWLSAFVLMISVTTGSKIDTACWDGEDAALSGFPWHVALFWRSDEQPGVYEYLNAGVLISELHVLTDTTAIDIGQDMESGKNVSSLYVVLGDASLRWNPERPGILISKVARVFKSHDIWNYWNLGVMELEVPVEINSKVQPVCVDSSIPLKDGDAGVIGAPDLSGRSTLTAVAVNYVDGETCGQNNGYVGNGKYCVDSQKEDLCPEDVGDAFVTHAADGRWLLKGLLATNTVHQYEPSDKCDRGLTVASDVDGLVDYMLKSTGKTCYTGPASGTPWHAMIYRQSGPQNEYQLICGGTLVSHRFVVSDSSCFWNATLKEPIGVQQFLVALGKKTTPLDVREHEAQILHISHVELRNSEGGGGIALLELETLATYDDGVAAVCLDTPRVTPLRESTFGTVAGVAPNVSSGVKIFNMNYLNSSKCMNETSDSPTGYFCGKDRKAVFCPGNEGSGFLVRGASGKWLLKGVAAPQPSQSEDACPRRNAIFTSVDDSLRWIIRSMNNLTVSLRLLNPGGNVGCWSGRANDLPWQALIYRQLQRPDWYELICTGTLITKRHIITDAACFWDESSGKTVDLQRLRVAVGKKTRRWGGKDRLIQIRKVSRITMMDGYDINKLPHNGSLAVVILEFKVSYTDAVRSVCIDFSGGIPQEKLRFGLVGVLDSQLSATQQTYNMDVLNVTACLQELPVSTCQYIGNDTFCAADRKVSQGLCEGNAGAGLVARGPAGEWLLKGVALAEQVRTQGDSCSQTTVLFSAVDDHRQWLRDVLGRKYVPQSSSSG